MSSLGISLLILVVVCIGGVIVFNLWQQRRAAQAMNQSPGLSESFDAERTEPSFGGAENTLLDTGSATGNSPLANVPSASTTSADAEPVIHNPDVFRGPDSASVEPDKLLAVGDASDPASDSEPEAATDPAASEAPTTNTLTPEDLGAIDPDELSKFETVVILRPLSDVRGQRLIELTQELHRVGTKAVTVGSPGIDTADPLVAEQTYQALQLSLLMVDRRGPVTALEYSEFVNKVQAVADELDVLADVPDMNRVLARAKQLAVEVNGLDARVAVNVQVEKELAASDLKPLADQHNLVHQGDDVYQRMGDDEQVVFSVSLSEVPNRVMLLLDVPRIQRERQPIREMVECAWRIAQATEGKMVDDSGRAIDNDLFERVESQLDIHYDALLAAGLPAGSTMARRVFT